MRKLSWIVAVLCVFLLTNSCILKKKTKINVEAQIERLDKEHEEQKQKQKEVSNSDPSDALVADGIAARVNEDVILLSDVNDAGERIFEEIRQKAPAGQIGAEIKKAQRMVLDRLIEKKLMEQKARDFMVTVTDQEVERTIDGYLAQRNMTRTDLYLDLARRKKSLEEYKEQVKVEIKVIKMIDYEINDRINITDEQCREYYDANREEYEQSKGVRIQQIVLLTRGKSVEKAKKREELEHIRQRIAEGEDFGKMAQLFSEGPNANNGGDAGYFQKGELLEALDQWVFKNQVGDVSPVIKSAVGFHLLKITDRQGGNKDRFEEVKEQIRSKFKMEQQRETLKEWMDELKETAYIDIRL